MKKVDVRPGYPINMAHLFHSWFIWGFWGSIFTVAILATTILLHFTMVDKRDMIHISSALCLAISVANNFIWYLMGCFWRFSKAGQVVSGDKLNKSAADIENTIQKFGY